MIYTFECEKCEARTDLIRQMQDAHLPVACECGAQMDRVWGRPQILTRGDPDHVPKKHQTVDFGAGPIGRKHMVGIGEAAAKRKEWLAPVFRC